MALWNVYQQHRIEQTDRRVAGVEASSEIRNQRRVGQIEELEQRLDRLILVNHSLWRLIQQRTGMTDAELQAEVDRLDSFDGDADGRRNVTPGSCLSCEAAVHPRAERCTYCGADAPARAVFDTI